MFKIRHGEKEERIIKTIRRERGHFGYEYNWDTEKNCYIGRKENKIK